MRTFRLKHYAALAGYYLIARWLPRSDVPYGRWARPVRSLCARHIFDSCGAAVNLERGAHFGSGAGIIIGNGSGIGINARVSGPLRIGSDVMMGPDVVIYTRNHRFADLDKPMIEQGFDGFKEVRIGDDVWIGGRVTILPGRQIGSGAIVGAGSVVTADIPDYAISAGNPARIVGHRSGHG